GQTVIDTKISQAPPRDTLIERVIAGSARNKFLVFIFTIFAVAAGIFGLLHTPLDAIPDLSEVQVIVFSEWEGRSPDLVEDQVTYPLVTTLLGTPHVSSVRGQSMFGYSFVNVLFEEGTDLYWARSRVLEYLSSATAKLPEGGRPRIGRDATGVGWVYEYALVDRTGRSDLSELQALQDWTLRYALQAVPGVAEVASVGGFQKEYQVDLDPNRLAALGVSLGQVMEAVR